MANPGVVSLVWGCGDDASTTKIDASGTDVAADVAGDVAMSGLPTAADLGRACVIASACGAIGLTDCFTDSLFTYYSEVVQCVLAAGSDCSAVQACRGYTVTPDPACTPTCTGTTAVNCSGGNRYSFDCTTGFASTGPTCQLSGGAQCTGGACTAADDICDGTKLRSCSSSVLLDFDCGHFGWSCVSGASGTRCSDGSAVACSTFDETCSGNQVVFCRNGFQVKRDCAAVATGATCYAQSNGRAYCGVGNACEPGGSGVSTCTTATTLSYCAGGVQQTFDCVAMGFSGCTSGRCAP